MLRLTHSIARNDQVMNLSVFGRTEACMSHDRKGERERERDEERERKLQSQKQRTRSLGSGVH